MGCVCLNVTIVYMFKTWKCSHQLGKVSLNKGLHYFPKEFLGINNKPVQVAS